MATTFPTTLDAFTNPSATDTMDSSALLYHDVQHTDINDAVEAIQAYIGVTNSVDVESLTYKANHAALTNVANTFSATNAIDLGTGALPASPLGAALKLAGANGGNFALEMTGYAASPNLVTRFAGNTRSAPVAALAGNALFVTRVFAWDGTAFVQTAQLRARASAAHSATEGGTEWRFSCAAIGDVTRAQVDSLTIDALGIVVNTAGGRATIQNNLTTGTDVSLLNLQSNSGGVLSFRVDDLSLANPAWMIRSNTSEPIVLGSNGASNQLAIRPGHTAVSIGGAVAAPIGISYGFGVVGENSAVQIQGSSARVSGTPASIDLGGYVFHGTHTAPTQTELNDNVRMTLGGRDDGGNTLFSQAMVQLVAAGNWSTTSRPTRIVFAVTAVNATTQSSPVSIGSDGVLMVDGQGSTLGLTTFKNSGTTPRLQQNSINIGRSSFGQSVFGVGLTAAPEIIQARSLSSTFGTYTTTTDGTILGRVAGEGVDTTATNFRRASEIRFEQDGAAGAAGVPGRFVVSLSDNAGTFTNRLEVTAGGVNTSTAYLIGSTQVVGARKTGWAIATGTATRTTFVTSTVTLSVLAEHVKALIDDLHNTAGHGLIGT